MGWKGNKGKVNKRKVVHSYSEIMTATLQEELRRIGKPKLPGKNWIYGLLHWHPDLNLKWPSGLNPKCAQNFNPTVVKNHFLKLGKLIQDNDIPWKNIYNMDEKGIQLGGGRKLDNTKFLFGKEQQIHVKIQSTDLELVTIIESISAV